MRPRRNRGRHLCLPPRQPRGREGFAVAVVGRGRSCSRPWADVTSRALPRAGPLFLGNGGFTNNAVTVKRLTKPTVTTLVPDRLFRSGGVVTLLGHSFVNTGYLKCQFGTAPERNLNDVQETQQVRTALQPPRSAPCVSCDLLWGLGGLLSGLGGLLSGLGGLLSGLGGLLSGLGGMRGGVPVLSAAALCPRGTKGDGVQ